MKLLLLALVPLFPLIACATGAIPKCWKVYDPELHDGLYHITIPATDSLTAKDVQTILQPFQGVGISSHSITAMGETILVEVQFLTLDQGKNLGYPTQNQLEEMVTFTMRNVAPYTEKGVAVGCFAETLKKHH
jgi:hypothetical protein